MSCRALWNMKWQLLPRITNVITDIQVQVQSTKKFASVAYKRVAYNKTCSLPDHFQVCRSSKYLRDNDDYVFRHCSVAMIN